MSLSSALSEIWRNINSIQGRVKAVENSVHTAPSVWGRVIEATISSDAIDVTRPHTLLIPESGTSDDLHNITSSAGGKMAILRLARGGDTITIKHDAGGNIRTQRRADIVLDARDQSVMLIYHEALDLWIEVGGADDSVATLADLGDLADVTIVTPSDGQVLTYDNGSGIWVNETPDYGPDTFVELTDTPADYVGHAAKFAKVNVGETALEFAVVTWTDVDSKPSTFPPDAHTHVWADITDPPSSFTPSAHAATHQHSGGDEIAVDTPTANAIPKAGASGKLSTAWVDSADVVTTATNDATGVTPALTDRIVLTDASDSYALKRATIDDVLAPAAKHTGTNDTNDMAVWSDGTTLTSGIAASHNAYFEVVNALIVSGVGGDVQVANTLGVNVAPSTDAQLDVVSGAAGRHALRLKAAASPTVPVFEVEDSSGSAVFGLDETGAAFSARSGFKGMSLPSFNAGQTLTLTITNNSGSNHWQHLTRVKVVLGNSTTHVVRGIYEVLVGWSLDTYGTDGILRGTPNVLYNDTANVTITGATVTTNGFTLTFLAGANFTSNRCDVLVEDDRIGSISIVASVS